MIRINLRPGAKRASAGSPFAGLGERAKGLMALVKEPMLALAVALAAIVVIGGAWGFIGTSMQTNRLRPELDEARSENQRFRILLGQIRREERIRDSVATELITLRQVDQDRYVWPHVLEDVSRALPPMTWLIGMAPVSGSTGGIQIDDDGNVIRPPLQVEITGRAMDIQGFTRFMRQLEDSPWLRNVTAVSANTMIEANRPVTAFVVRADFVEADSVYIRRVPVAQALTGGEG